MKNVYMIGNTHFDPVWLWRWDEAMASICSTFRSALDRMNEDKDFIYSFCTPPVFEWIKKVDPKMFKEIKARIKEGRWELNEGWWVQPDCFSASGESYARQSLYGQRYLKDNFGKTAKTVFNVDSFGHAQAIPQILKKSGIDNYCMCRPENHHYELLSPYFNWKSKDGSSVRAFRVGQYSPIYHKDVPTIVAIAEENLKNATCDEMTMFGVTNHGGAPTKKALADVHRLDAEKDYDIKCSSVEGFFARQGEPTITVDGEMITGDFGPYLNGPEVKKRNRICEYALLNAERSAVIAKKLLKTPYDKQKLNELWQDVMFNQFHDILGGACIKDAYDDTYNGLGRATLSANEMTAFNLQAITRKIKMPGKNPENAWNVVVWNLNATEFDGYVEAEVQWLHEFDAYEGGILLEDEFGNSIPCQVILEKSVITGFRSRFIFKAKIPAIGYRAFKVIQTKEKVVKDYSLDTVITKGDFEFTFDKKGKTLTKIKNLKSGKEIQNLIVPEVYEDLGDTWCFNAHEVGKKLEPLKVENVSVTEKGELLTVVKVDYSFRKSLFTVWYSLYKDADYFDVRYRADWNEKHTTLKLKVNVKTDRLKVSSPFSVEDRGYAKIDVPMGEWISIENKEQNLSVLADGIFSYTADESGIGLSVLRSCIYGDLRISELDKNADYQYMCQGETEGKIRVIMHECDYVSAKIPSRAVEFNNQPKLIIEANHTGSMPSVNSFAGVLGNVLVTAIKESEDKKGTIIRLYDYTGSSQSVEISLFDKKIKTMLSPFEIKTILVKKGKTKEVLITEY